MESCNKELLFQTRNVYEELKLRRNELNLLLHEKERCVGKAPEGSLHIVKKAGKSSSVQYYRRNDPKDKSGKYIKKSEESLVKALAQKDYDRKIIKIVAGEIKAIDRILKQISKRSIRNTDENIQEERKKLINTVMESDEIFMKNWLADSYENNYMDDSKIYLTKKNEKVRSKSEVIIANLLEEYGVLYKYEKPLKMNNSIWTIPDFTVLNIKERKEYYWEHFGMMDDVEYLNKTLKKITRYEKMGMFPGKKLIFTFESSNIPISTKEVERMIQEFLL